MSVLMIGVAGGLGSVLRYGMTLALGRALGTGFPYGTLGVNVIGSFLLGVIAEAFSGATLAGVDARLVLGVGLMGGFTTYSSFNLETLRLLDSGDPAKALLYLGSTVITCLGAGAFGLWVARLITRGLAA
jgi:fluoride exporter